MYKDSDTQKMLLGIGALAAIIVLWLAFEVWFLVAVAIGFALIIAIGAVFVIINTLFFKCAHCELLYIFRKSEHLTMHIGRRTLKFNSQACADSWSQENYVCEKCSDYGPVSEVANVSYSCDFCDADESYSVCRSCNQTSSRQRLLKLFNSDYAYISREGTDLVKEFDNQSCKDRWEEHNYICESCFDLGKTNNSLKLTYRGCIFDFCSIICQRNWADANSNQIKGEAGERQLSDFLRENLDGSYHIFNDVSFWSSDYGSTQIDHIVVSVHGVFVIETKNWAGQVLGLGDEKKWIQTFNNRQQQLDNPIRQNEAHLEAIGYVFNMSREQMFSLVAFVGSGQIKTDSSELVKDLSGSLKYIKSKTRILLNEFEVDSIIEKVNTHRIPNNRESLRKHLNRVSRQKASANYGYDKDSYNIDGEHSLDEVFDVEGYDRDGYNVEGYNRYGYDRDGYDRNGGNRNPVDEDDYDTDDYAENSYGEDGYNRYGYDRDGYDRNGYGISGYSRDGYDRDGYSRSANYNKDDSN